MSTDHIKTDIPLYLSGGLTESQNRQIEAHAAACDKCRAAISKARAKQARVKREALKKADPLPNMFLARQGKEVGVDRKRSKLPWAVWGLILVSGLAFWAYRQSPMSFRAKPEVLPESESSNAGGSSVLGSTATESAVPAPAAAVPAPAPAENKTEPVKPVAIPLLQDWKGLDSGIQESRLVVIRNEQAWEKLWSEMLMIDAKPEVNFNVYTAVGVFGGERPAGTSVSFAKAMEVKDEVVALYRFSAAAIQVSTAPAQPHAHPYAFSLISRTDKKIRLTQKEISQ